MSNSPRLRVPPPIYFAAGFGVGVALHWAFPLALPDHRILSLIGWVLIFGALLLVVSAVWLFCAVGTNMLPYRPARTFVQSGPYTLSRNPMYLALAVVYVGLSFVFAMFWPLLFLPVVIWMVQNLVIRPEELHLKKVFGEEYTRYMHRVRRWI